MPLASLEETLLNQAVEGILVVLRAAWCRWRAPRGCLALVAATKIILAAGGCHMGVGSGCLQRTAAVDIACQLSVRRGTASEGGACDTIIEGRLGLQRTAAGCSALLGNFGVVHHRKMAQVTT